MDKEFSLRCYCYLDRMKANYAAVVETITQGDLPVEGMASLYIEMAPGNEVFRTVDIAVKATEAKPGAQVVEREFGMFEVHSLNQAAVLESGRIVLERLGLNIEDRIRPKVASIQLITNIDPYQAQLLKCVQKLHRSSSNRGLCIGMGTGNDVSHILKAQPD